MKKKLIITITIVCIFLALIPLCIPAVRYIYNYLTWGDYYGDEYSTKWTSNDGCISFVVDNSKGIQGTGSYKGTYIDNKGNTYEITLDIDGYMDIRLDYTLDSRILYGKGRMNYYADAYTVIVEKAESEKSIYKTGDEIIFTKQK